MLPTNHRTDIQLHNINFKEESGIQTLRENEILFQKEETGGTMENKNAEE